MDKKKLKQKQLEEQNKLWKEALVMAKYDIFKAMDLVNHLEIQKMKK